MRPSVDQYFINLASLVATRATCRRRRVGCVLVNEQDHVMATGFNGVSKGAVHCLDAPCKGALSKSGADLNQCLAIHAENNALIQCSNISAIRTVYCTVSPCLDCMNLLINTGATRLVFGELYSHSYTPLQMWDFSDAQRTTELLPATIVIP